MTNGVQAALGCLRASERKVGAVSRWFVDRIRTCLRAASADRPRPSCAT